MLARFRNGCLTTIRRKDGVERWLFRWRERCSDGTLRERNKVIGTVEEYPIKSKKLHEAVTRLRVNINTDGPTELTSITMAKAVDHYTVHELADCGAEGKAYSTRSRKTQLLSRWVVPHWGKVELRAIKTVAVEQWLKTLVTAKFGKPKPLAGGTREKIRDAMSSIFNHAIRWELTDRNPITGPTKRSGVRVSAKRECTPDILEIQEMRSLLAALGIRERAMLFLDMPSGLRRGELAGLKWEDFDFKTLHVSVARSLSTVMRDYIQPMARKLGIQKKMSWHTFRHTFSSLLKGNGEDVKVVQELLRHSTAKMTLDTYTQALSPQKRAAQSKVVGMIRSKPSCTVVVPRVSGEIPVTH